MTDPRPLDPPEQSVFARSWRWILPLAIATMAVALATAVFDTGATSAWIFAGGAAIGIVGLASLVTRLVGLGRRRMRALEKRLEDEFEDRGGGRR